MPIKLNGDTFFRTSEVCRLTGISRATLFRWFAEGILADIKLRDRNGWRLFTGDDIERIKMEASRSQEQAGKRANFHS